MKQSLPTLMLPRISVWPLYVCGCSQEFHDTTLPLPMLCSAGSLRCGSLMVTFAPQRAPSAAPMNHVNTGESEKNWGQREM